MARCTHCSAPLPKGSMVCEYCDVRNDIELKQKDVGRQNPTSNRFCPNCLAQLESVNVGSLARFVVEKCPKCYGLFFDHHELEKLLEESVEQPQRIDHRKLHELIQSPRHQDDIVYRRCPVCDAIMQRKNYARRSGIVIDVCYEHGMWLDAGEFKQLQEWIRLGGEKKALLDPPPKIAGAFSKQDLGKKEDSYADVLLDILTYAWR